LFQAFLRQDLRFFDRPENTVGALTSYIDTYAQAIFEFMGLSCAIVVMSIVTIIACSILSVVVSWKLGLVGVFGAIPPMLLSGYTRLRIETKMGTDINAKFAKSSSIASESITAIRTVSSLAIEKDVLRRYAAELDEAIEQSRPRLFMAMLFSSFTQALEFFILALGFWYVRVSCFAVMRVVANRAQS
jgi:ATP-binding cassette, subfamily B (MDR/TAP), member 1